MFHFLLYSKIVKKKLFPPFQNYNELIENKLSYLKEISKDQEVLFNFTYETFKISVIFIHLSGLELKSSKLFSFSY